MSVMESKLEFRSAIGILEAVHGYTELQQLIEAAKAISFDFFDTLFIRPLANPEDAFDILGRQFAIADFRERRRAAQVEAFRRMHAVGRKEITLADIYACFAETVVPSSELMRAEYALELALVEPNPEMFALFCTLLDTGKPVVITSDMYLSADFFIDALRPHGLAHVPLFISADCNATKRDAGELFDVVVSQLGLTAGDILHIGDNQQADVTRPCEKGLMAFHYRASREHAVKKTASLTTSIGHGLLRTSARYIPSGSYAELGFIYGGAANFGFLQWVRERTRLDHVDHVLFLSRDGYALERIAQAQVDSGFPAFCYFLGSRTAYTLAAIKADNFSQFMPFLLSGSEGLAPCELLERIGVQPPSPSIMADLGLGAGVCVSVSLHEKLASFLYAYRWEILKVCQRNRRALYCYLRQLGIGAGSRVALVDVGWSGTTQEAFELAVRPLMDLEVLGYYFCLADTPERLRREQTQRMSAMVTAASTSAATIARIYANRVAVELFFSAPHHSVIGLQAGAKGIEPVLDAGRGNIGNFLQIAQEVSHGVESFAVHYGELQQRLGVLASPLQIAWPLIELVTEERGPNHQLLEQVKNFDAWGSSRNHELSLADYLQ
ncbi:MULTISPECIES: HAD family hydrolase [Pseudomonas]|uniref:HAD family hydrolase n=2 Tax=Pseudomonas TaxID=286 RepID=UPI001294B8A3|nr:MULTISPECIES: haloacid dehalogenase [Pseudomonas]MCF5507458.1 haloacid dehalogenase [Pseudomonas sp. PA-3-6H]MCF5517830.1 haloacid dehalogenase [Pseudomonas sp. PA-3-6E]MCF5564176.1 haloacid dehalogenase [Pseudomonas sp. PA-3-5D]MCF5566481.1 haloacid dehalogenase [Pseudomonas sp. PA-3-11C]MCF5592138.1 haloacid dehalogenase [Pseudomonas sp. PA-3-10C]